MSKVLAIARFTLLEAFRTRLIWLVLALVALLLLAGVFVQQLAVTETWRLRTGFLAAATRFALVFVLCLHVASSMVREFNDKGIDLLLSLDLPRTGYYLGKLLGFVAAGWLLAGVAALALATTGMSAGWLAWSLSLALELTLIATLTLFCVITFAQIMPAVSVVAAFYLLARSIAAIRLISGSQLLDQHSWTTRAAGWLVDVMALVLPDLSRFTQTQWLLSGSPSPTALGFVALQALVYGALLTLAGLFDLHRRNF
jgi:ABC-type transport system involved in multi-copper enzyme maturation permease subunit